MIVVDTNILAYFVVRVSFSKECSTLYERDPPDDASGGGAVTPAPPLVHAA